MPPRRVVAVNERGQRIGQDHPHAQLTDAEVNILLGLRVTLCPSTRDTRYSADPAVAERILSVPNDATAEEARELLRRPGA
jgi:hypothetical protein